MTFYRPAVASHKAENSSVRGRTLWYSTHDGNFGWVRAGLNKRAPSILSAGPGAARLLPLGWRKAREKAQDNTLLPSPYTLREPKVLIQSDVDFDQLHTFLEIVRLKSFSKAAQTCFRTQPAISAQIRQMEQELGTQLFERFGSRISLTTAGRIFAEFAQQILQTRRQAFDAVRELDRVPRGEVVLAANEATCVHVLPQVFSTFKQRFPEVQLQVIRSYGAQTVQAVMDNSVDFGITQLPVQERRLQVVQIYSDEIRLLVPAMHPLAKASSAGPEQIAKYPLLLPKSGRTRSRIDEYLAGVEDRLNISMELESSEMIKQFTIAGLGLGFMGVSNARNEIQRKALCAIALSPLPMVRNLGLIYRKDKPLSRASLGLIDVVADFARHSESNGQPVPASFGPKSAPKAS